MDIGDLTGSLDTQNRPGIGGKVYAAELPWLTAMGTFATNTIPGDEDRITGDHTFATGKGFREWECEDDVSNLVIPVTGSKGSLGLKPELTVFWPGLTPSMLWHARQNKKLILLVQAFGCNSTQYLQLGDACNPVRIMPSDGWKSGTAGGNDARGMTVKLGSNYSVYFYEGDLVLYP